jgi:acyl-coenzyme A thioesterase PaaI-like protein
MNVLDLPYNNYIGLKDADEDKYLLELPESKKYLNHLKTVHAGALFSLAEASSGKFLLNEFADIKFPIIPMLRKATVKYSKAVKGTVRSRGKLLDRKKEFVINELEMKSRALIDVVITLYSKKNEKVMSAVFQWFVTKV